MSDVNVIDNHETKIEEIVKLFKEGSVSKDDFKSKFGELQQAVEQKHKDVESDLNKKESEFEAKMETKMSELVEKLTSAFNKVNHQTKSIEESKFGNCLGEFMKKVRHEDPDIKAALAGSVGSTGGYLVPEQFSSEILKVAMEQSIVRQRARVIPMTSSIIRIPALNVASNAAGSMYGGVAAYWEDENADTTESEPTFKRVTLEPKNLNGYTESGNDLDDDAIVSMGSLLSEMFGEVLSFEEDYAFLNGDGVGKPTGVTTSPAYITVSRNSGSIVVTADIVDMLSRFKGNLNRAVFVVNQSALPYIYKLMDENDNYIWHPSGSGSISNAPPTTLYGVPIVVSEKVPAVGTTGDVMLCDFGYYLIGNRKELSIEESVHYKFKSNKKAWRITKRVDGKPWLDSAITPRAGGSTLSPFVGIG